MERIGIRYDPESDFLEVIFKQKEGYFKETLSDQVIDKVDPAGNIIGFSILNICSLKAKPVEVELVKTEAGIP
ncbi:MAG: DUF2283 domain-containing protein [Chloroflexi bacterium]|nr:DUF2283 domain-containing protein [Chloroflexota bacterium]